MCGWCVSGSSASSKRMSSSFVSVLVDVVTGDGDDEEEEIGGDEDDDFLNDVTFEWMEKYVLSLLWLLVDSLNQIAYYFNS